MPQQVSWITIHIFVKWSNTRHNGADGKCITTVPATEERKCMINRIYGVEATIPGSKSTGIVAFGELN